MPPGLPEHTCHDESSKSRSVRQLELMADLGTRTLLAALSETSVTSSANSTELPIINCIAIIRTTLEKTLFLIRGDCWLLIFCPFQLIVIMIALFCFKIFFLNHLLYFLPQKQILAENPFVTEMIKLSLPFHTTFCNPASTFPSNNFLTLPLYYKSSV